MLRYLPYLVVIALWIYAFVDCLGTPEREVRGLPKVVWVLIILFFGEVLIGPLAWLIAGRRRGPLLVVGTPGHPVAGRYAADGTDLNAGPERPREWIAPDDNPEFLRSLDDRKRKGEPPSENG